MPPLFADHNSTTPVDERVLKTMAQVSHNIFGNPSSGHAFGSDAAQVVWEARELVAELVDCRPVEVFFTSGATESNNWILAQERWLLGRGLLTTRLEHPSILVPATAFANRGGRVEYLDIDQEGRVTLPTESPLPSNTAESGQLVSVIAAHNEFHFVTNLPEVAKWCRDHGARLHSDATQAVGRVPISFSSLGLSAMSLSAHKLYGPKGIGALIIAEDIQPMVRPLLYGGGHQDGLRSGTLPTPLIAGLGEACRLAGRHLTEDAQRLHHLVEVFLRCLTEKGVNFRLIGPPRIKERLPGCVSMILPHVETSHFCDLVPELAISTSSACKTQRGSVNGLDPDDARHFVRIGFGRNTTGDDVERVARLIATVGSQYHAF